MKKDLEHVNEWDKGWEAAKKAYAIGEHMTLLDHFAAAALPGLSLPSQGNSELALKEMSHDVAEVSYALAEAMLAERERRRGK